MLPFASDVIPCGVLNWFGPAPRVPSAFTHLPSLLILATRELLYPSLTKMLSCVSQVTSVRRVNVPGLPGGYRSDSFSPRSKNRSRYSIASVVHPSSIDTMPCGMNLTIMFAPSSVIHTLSYLSTRNVWENDEA